MERFFSKLQGQTMKEDKIVWKEDNKGVFFVRGFYLLLEIDCTTLFALKIIWNSWIPLKVSFFTQEACWEMVPTLDQLQRRGWMLTNRYALCKRELESIDHILFHCDKARILWQLVFTIFGILWVLFESIKETLLGWHDSFVYRRRIAAWRAAPPYIFWMIQ